MNKAHQFTTFVTRLKACADVRNTDGAIKVIQEGKLILRLPQLLPRDQISVLQSFETLGMKFPTLWEAIAKTFNTNMEKKLPYEIASLGTLVAKNGNQSLINWNVIEHRVINGDNQSLAFDPYLVNIHTFFATYNRGSDQFWSKSETLCYESIGNAIKSQSNMQTLNNLLSKLVWSYGSMKKGSPHFWSEVAKLSKLLINDHTPRSFGKLLLAVSKVKMLPEDFKQDLAKQAAIHLNDSNLSVIDLHDIVLGLDNINPYYKPELTDTIADIAHRMLQKEIAAINKTFLSFFHRILFELIEIRGLSENKRIILEEDLAKALNNSTNPKLLANFEERALVYFATLPSLNQTVLEMILRIIDQKNFSVESLIKSEPGDFQLLIDFLRVTNNHSQTIDSKIEDQPSANSAFVINKLGLCLAKFELSKSQCYPSSFNAELATSLIAILSEFVGGIQSGFLEPPAATEPSSGPLGHHLAGEASARGLLRQAARAYAALSPPQVADLCCGLLAAIYLRHQHEAGHAVEAFVLKHQHFLAGSPFLLAAVCAVKNSVGSKDKASLLRLLGSQADLVDHRVLANALLFFKEVAHGRRVEPGSFATEVADVKQRLPLLVNCAVAFIETGSWPPETQQLFTFNPKTESADVITTEVSNPQEPVAPLHEFKPMVSDPLEPTKRKQFERPLTVDMLGAYLELKYPEDPDFPKREPLNVSIHEHQVPKTDPISKPKRIVPRKKGITDNNDLIFTQSNKKSEYDDIEKIKLRK
jgi:hypothetical protein